MSTWELDKLRRWRSPSFLAYVRTLPCSCRDPRCPNCASPWDLGNRQRSPIQAAHLRLPSTGMGAKPDDFLVYPLTAFMHEAFHRLGQPDVTWQLERVMDTWRRAFTDGVLLLGEKSLGEVESFGAVIPF